MVTERLPTPQQALGDKNKYRAIKLSNGIEALLIEGKNIQTILINLTKGNKNYLFKYRLPQSAESSVYTGRRRNLKSYDCRHRHA